MNRSFNFHTETISAIFIIAFVSLFILANFAAGFILPLFVLAMAAGAGIAFFYPRSGMAVIIFLTFIYERFFTLQPIIWGRAEYKLYPLDIILIAVLAGVIFNFISNLTNSYGLRSQSIRVVNSGNKKLFFEKIFPFCKRGSDCERAQQSRDFYASNNSKNPSPTLPFTKGERITDLYLIIFIILSAIYFIASVFFLNSDFNLSFSSFKHYAFYPLLYFAVVYLFNSKERILWLFKFAFAGAVGIIFFVIYGLINGAGLWSEFTPLSTEGIRTLAFPHAFYISLAVIGLITYLIFSEKNVITNYTGRSKMLYKNLYWILILVWMVGIIGSMMRHLWISLFISVAVLFLMLPKEKRYNLKKILSQSAALVVMIIIFVVYFALLLPTSGFKDVTNSIGDIIESRVSSLASISGDESFSWRGIVWKEAVGKYLGSPVFGIGFGQKIYVEIEKYKDFVEVRNIHNSPLVILVQMGIAAIFLLAAFVYKNIKALCQKTNKDWIDLALIAILANYLVAFLFQPYLETNLLGIFFWVVLGIIRIINSGFTPTKYEQVQMYEKY